MPELAFVVFEEERQKGRLSLAARYGLFRTTIGAALFHLFNKKKFRSGIIVIEIEVGIEILLIKLPFPLSMLSALNKQYFERHISRVYSAMGCRKCFVPVAARRLGWLGQYSADTNSRSVIFKALLLPILDEIYTKSCLRLDNLDIAFVSGENADELLTMVKQLEPHVRYINVASSDKEYLGCELADICADSGISIFTGSDFKNILRNADIIINLGKTDAISKYRIRSRSLVINFFNRSSPILHGEFTVIMGVEYTFPESRYDIFGEDIQRSFTRAELTDIWMASKAGLLNGGSYNETKADLILSIFENNCCRITGFSGRRGVLRVGNVLKAIRERCKIPL